MSIRAIDAASRLKMEPRDKFVIIALANYANDEHRAWPKHQSLADFTGYSRMTVIRALESLESNGFIRSTKRYNEGHQQSNMYTLVFLEKQSRVQSKAESQGDTQAESQAVTQQGNNVIPPESQRDTPRVTTSSKAESHSVTHNRQLEPSIEPNPPTPLTVHGTDESVETQEKEKPKKQPFDPTTVELPPFIEKQTWLDFCTHRKEVKAKLTPKATELTLKKLRDYPEFASQMLENTIANGWRGVFPPRQQTQNQAQQDSPKPRVGDEVCNFGEWYKITEVLPDGTFYTECPTSGHVPSRLAEFGSGFRRCPN